VRSQTEFGNEGKGIDGLADAVRATAPTSYALSVVLTAARAFSAARTVFRTNFTVL